MPIYEYICSDCEKVTETIQKVDDAPLGECSHCNSNHVEKLISQSAFHLKGGGWYKSGYAGASNTAGDSKTAKKIESKSTDKKEKSTEAKSAKPAASCGGGCKCH